MADISKFERLLAKNAASIVKRATDCLESESQMGQDIAGMLVADLERILTAVPPYYHFDKKLRMTKVTGHSNAYVARQLALLADQYGKDGSLEIASFYNDVSRQLNDVARPRQPKVIQMQYDI